MATSQTSAVERLKRIAHANQFLRVLRSDGEVIEPRALCVAGRKKRTDSGYFDDLQLCAEQAIALDATETPAGLYVTMNPLNPDLLARAMNRIKPWAEQTSNDSHVICRKWLFLDLDPVRVAGISATDAEHDAAQQRANDVRDWLMSEFGWNAPLMIDSGNGCYLVFPIDLPNDAAALELVGKILKAIGDKWNDDVVHIDPTVGNAARIMRLPGTANRKGDSTPDRPHRYCQMIDLPDYLEGGWTEPISREKLEAVAALVKEDEKPKSASAPAASGNRRLMVDTWLSARGVKFTPKQHSDRTVFAIDCPFNPEHRNEANITQFESGALAAGCFHASCASKEWADFRDAIGKPDGDHWDLPKRKRRERTPQTAAVAPTESHATDDGDIADPWTSIRTAEGRTDAAFSRRFIRDYGENVLWSPAWKSWLVWDGCRWKIDEGGCAVTRFAQAVSDAVWHEVADCPSKDAVDYAQDMSKPSKWTSALKAAAAERVISVAELNANRWLLPCPNGTVDLRTGELRRHRKEDLLTTLCPTEFIPDAQSYHWDRFLDGAIPSQPVQDYLQRLCGYALSGRAEKGEEILPVFHGDGSNGKSVFIESIRNTVGPDFATPGAAG